MTHRALLITTILTMVLKKGAVPETLLSNTFESKTCGPIHLGRRTADGGCPYMVHAGRPPAGDFGAAD